MIHRSRSWKAGASLNPIAATRLSAHNQSIVPFPWPRRSSKTEPRIRTADESLRLRRIFDETQHLAWRTLRRLGVPADRLDDAFQQVFLVTSERLADIELGCERGFVYGVALRVARSFTRRGREVLGDEPDLRPGCHIDADALLDRRRLIELCDRILEQLGPEVREVFVLHELEGLSGSEVARLLKVPEGTVYSRLRRARIRVREEIQRLEAASSSPEAFSG